MAIRFNASAFRAQVRSEMFRLESRARQAVRDNQRRLDQRVQSLTNGGRRPLTAGEVRQLAKESADYLKSKLK